MKCPSLAGILCLATFFSLASRAESLPPVPSHYFNDKVGMVAASEGLKMDARLVQFERDTSVQFLIVIFPKLDTDAKLEDYCTRVFNSWHVGQKGKNNGIVLFLFMAEHKSRLELGLGMQKVISDAQAAGILKDVLAPAFKRRDYAAGLGACVDAVIKATGAAFAGDGTTVRERQ